jgi:hypothetical protein
MNGRARCWIVSYGRFGFGRLCFDVSSASLCLYLPYGVLTIGLKFFSYMHKCILPIIGSIIGGGAAITDGLVVILMAGGTFLLSHGWYELAFVGRSIQQGAIINRGHTCASSLSCP